jgi:polysaccharide export outer membrane protein
VYFSQPPGFRSMRGAPILLTVLTALSVGGCMRGPAQTYYIMDPQTGQPVPVVTQQQQMVPPQNAQQAYAAPAANGTRALYSTSPAYAQQAYGQQQYAQPVYQPAAQPRGGRGLFNASRRAAPAYTQPPAQQPYIAQYTPPPAAAPRVGGPYAAAPNAYAAAPANYAPDYTLDSGDKLRVVVFGQDGITNSYTVDAGGNVNLPLIGAVPARGVSTQQLSREIAARLKQGYVREPHVTVEVETYRPFFILGEVTTPGQYPYVANMTAETAVAIAGGFAPRASKGKVQLTRNAPGQRINGEVPLNFPLRPGDTIVVKERWF